MEGEVAVPEKPDDSPEIPVLYKTQSFNVSQAGSGLGLDKGIDVVEGKLVENEEQPAAHLIHGVLHAHNDHHDPHSQHAPHHVQIGEAVVELLSGGEQEVSASPKPNPASHTEPPASSDEEATEVHPPGPAWESDAPEKNARLSSLLKAEGSIVDIIDSSHVFDAEFERKREKQQRRVQISKGTLKTLDQVFTKDSKKKDFFIESVLASQHVKELNARYGSKQKNVKQFFLESVDADTKLAVYGVSQVQEVRAGLRLEKRNSELIKQRTSSVTSAADFVMEEEPSKRKSEDISESVTLTDTTTISLEHDPRSSLLGTWNKGKNFWDSLERLEREQLPDTTANLCATGKGNPLVQIYGYNKTRNKRFLPPGMAEATKTPSIQQALEPFPNKYLESEVQEVIQADAVRRLWDIVNGQLELFDVRDPVAYEMFGVLYDEVRRFVGLPEEEIMDFNNGTWVPPPLNEKKILEMEPFEKLMTRFQVHQKAFCFLAQHFEQLTPLFAEIKQAYEDVFEKGERETAEVEREQMEELELRETLGKFVRDTDKAGYRLLMQTKAEAHALQEQIQWQHHTLHTILGILWKMRSSLKMTSWAVTQLKALHKTKIEALAKEIVSTQGQMLFDMALPGKYTEIMQRIRNQADAKEIRRMLLAVRRQLRAAARKIIIYEADYADTVPKSEFEVPQKKHSIISKKNQALSDACSVLKAERTMRKEVIAALEAEISEVKKIVEDLRQKPTPRPSFTKISSSWPNGQEEFEEMRQAQTSTRGVLNKIVEDLTGKKVSTTIHHIQPLGRGIGVPLYLRYDRPVLHKDYTCAEANVYIKDIWNKRMEGMRLFRKIKVARREEEDGLSAYPDDLPYELPQIGTLSEFIMEYFYGICQLEEVRMEWTYNLLEACKTHSTDPRLAQFKGILDGVVDESVFHLFQMELDRLREVMYAKANASAEHRGYLEWPEVIKILTEQLPNKTAESMAAVDNLGGMAYGVRGTWALVRVQNLLEDDDNWKESDLVDLLHRQYDEERKEYLRDIYMEVLSELGISERLLEHEDDPVWQTDVSMHLFYAVLMSVDQTLPEQKLIAYLAWIYLGIPTLPDITTLSIRLIEYLRERTKLSEEELEKFNEDDDLEFENCIRELREYEEDDATMDKLDLKKRRLATTKLKFASLRQFMDRLTSGPFMRFGERVIKVQPVAEPESEVAVVEVPSKEDKKRKHRHRHRRHRDRRASRDEEEEADDFGFDSDF